MKIKFEIERESVLFQVKNQAYKAGESMKEGEMMNLATKVQPSDEDDDLLCDFIDTSVAKIIDIVSGHLELVEVNREDSVTEKGRPSEKIVFDFDTPSNYDRNQDGSVLKGIKDYMVAYTLFSWYKKTYPKIADPSELEIIASGIKHRINQRTKPIRRPVRPLGF